MQALVYFQSDDITAVIVPKRLAFLHAKDVTYSLLNW